VREGEEGELLVNLKEREDPDWKLKEKNLVWNRLWTSHKTYYVMNE